MALTRSERHQLGKGLLFVSPWIVGFLLFVLYPIAASFYYSLTEFSILRPPVYVGAENYSTIVKDGLFWKAVWNTLIYALFALPMTLLTSLGIAMLLNQPVRFRGIFRTVFFLPSLVPLIALAILWQWIFNGQHGILNHALAPLLSWIGLHPPVWLEDPIWTKPALVATSLWGVGGSVVIYLAALQEVPRQLYEAAEIDGASPFQKFAHVTIPMISPVIYFNMVMGIICTLQVFAVPYVMFKTGRGPADSTYFFAMYIYDNAFKYLKMGYASALAWILFLLILGLTILASRISGKYIHYGD